MSPCRPFEPGDALKDAVLLHPELSSYQRAVVFPRAGTTCPLAQNPQNV